MTLTRRQFLTRSSLTVGSLLLPGGAREALAAVDPNKVLVTVFLNGGADGLNLVIPAGDSHYYDARPHAAVPPGDEIPLDSFFAVHPGLDPLLPHYFAGDLAVVHAVGSTDPTRSHFDAQDYMDHAAPGDKTIRDGWLNRYLATAGFQGCLAGVSVGSAISESLVGDAETLSLENAGQFSLNGFADIRRENLQRKFEGGPHAALGARMAQALGCLDTSALVGPASDAGYPDTGLGADLSSLAALIKADVGVHVATVRHGGWDTHDSELNQLAVQVPDLASSLAAFHADLGSHADRTLVLVMTEFGRRLRDNQTGTDHGHGSAMFLLGSEVNGGRVHLAGDSWPGLSEQDLHEGRDLQVTADFRGVFREVLHGFLGLRSSTTRDVLLGFDERPLRDLIR